ncbi:MAG: hypothetical protein V7731_15375 [Amphritea sp.]
MKVTAYSRLTFFQPDKALFAVQRIDQPGVIGHKGQIESCFNGTPNACSNCAQTLSISDASSAK